MSAPAPIRYHATVEYRTHAGNPGVWTGEVTATADTVHAVARAAAKRARRSLSKIDGGSAVPAVWVRP